MSLSVNASSNAFAYLQSLLAQSTAGAGDASIAADPLSTLLQTLSGSSSTAGQSSSDTAGTGVCAGVTPFGADTLAALISLQGQSANSANASSPSDLFSRLDGNGDGEISKSEFETALSGGGVSASSADTLFAKLDTNGDGSISESELAQTKGHHHHHMRGGGSSQASGSSGQSAVDQLLSSAGADGATTQTVTNADGSTTTTISYADGSTIDSTTPAASADSGTSSSEISDQSNANLLQKLIALQAQLLTMASSTLSAIA